MKTRLCRGHKLECARYRIYTKLGSSKVPPGLAPNDLERAQAILDDT